MKIKNCDIVVRGNCYELLKNIEPGSIDLILTDPPYVLNSGKSATFKGVKIYGSKKFEEICNGYDIDGFLNLCQRVCKKMNCFVFCSNAQVADIINWCNDRGYYSTILIWFKLNAIPFCKSSWKPDIEFIIHIREQGAYFQGNSKLCSKVYSSCTNFSQYGHPTEKPIRLLSKLISVASKEGDLILDPFLGSGSTLIAAKKLNRRCFGFEIKEEYCSIAKKRIEEFDSQPDLFC